MTDLSAGACQPTAERGTRLDPWVEHYAARATGMRPSEIRSLFSVASRPEVVSLAGRMPYVPALPLAELAETMARLVRDQGAVSLQYGSGQGRADLREQIVDVVALQGVRAHADDVVITGGSQMALDLLARIFCDPGDVVLVESPAYVGALGAFSSYQATIVHVPGDAHGMSAEALTAAVRRCREEGLTPKLVYTCPTFQNPTGAVMSPDRRAEILAVAQQSGVLLIEDDPYALLDFDGTLHPAIRSLDGEGVVYLGSFSKTVAPGLRVGWAVAPHGVREKLVLAAEAATLCPAAITQMTIHEYLVHAPWLETVKTLRELYRVRRDALVGGLAEMMPAGVRWNVPEGGFYSWLTLPEGLDSRALLPRAIAALVAFVPGTGFYADGQGQSNLRLSFCYPTPEEITEGVRRLAGVVRDEVELWRMFQR